ncbi:hypothetical protein IHE44_0005389, partial [Lamprotornis superbus]
STHRSAVSSSVSNDIGTRKSSSPCHQQPTCLQRANGVEIKFYKSVLLKRQNAWGTILDSGRAMVRPGDLGTLFPEASPAWAIDLHTLYVGTSTGPAVSSLHNYRGEVMHKQECEARLGEGTRQGLSSSSGLLQPPSFPTAPTAFPHPNLQHQLGTDQERRERCPSMVGLRKEGEKLRGRALRKEKRVETYLSALVSPGQVGWPSQGWRNGKHFKRWLCTQDVPASRSNLPSSTSLSLKTSVAIWLYKERDNNLRKIYMKPTSSLKTIIEKLIFIFWSDLLRDKSCKIPWQCEGAGCLPKEQARLVICNIPIKITDILKGMM